MHWLNCCSKKWFFHRHSYPTSPQHLQILVEESFLSWCQTWSTASLFFFFFSPLLLGKLRCRCAKAEIFSVTSRSCRPRYHLFLIQIKSSGPSRQLWNNLSLHSRSSNNNYSLSAENKCALSIPKVNLLSTATDANHSLAVWVKQEAVLACTTQGAQK